MGEADCDVTWNFYRHHIDRFCALVVDQSQQLLITALAVIWYMLG
jgi:hypothetical protein